MTTSAYAIAQSLLPPAFIEWLMNETSGTTAFDTGTNSTTYNAPYTGTPTQVNDVDLGDSLEFDRASTDAANAGNIETITNVTIAMALKSNDASNSAVSVYHSNQSGVNSGDMGSSIESSSTIFSFFVQTSGGTTTITGTITNNIKHVIVVTWNSVTKTLTLYIDDMVTAKATNTYTGAGVFGANTEPFTIGDTNLGSSVSAGFRGNKVRIYNFDANASERAAIKAIT